MTDPDAFRAPDPRMISFRTPPPAAGAGRHLPAPVPQAEPSRSPAAERHRVDGDEPGAPGDAGVRPFVITQGRTAPVDERLRIETQVVATPQAGGFVLDFECRRIVDLCATPLSVAEIAAALELPIVVARVLVADLASVGAVTVHEQDQQVSRALLERILERVHAL
jgi:hypothetical protein